MNNNQNHIIFCSTSYFEYDRRLQRIISALQKNEYSIDWISREYSLKSKVLPKINHQKLRTYYKSGVLFYLEINIRIFIKLLFSKANIICSIDNDTILSCYYASKLTRKKLVFDAHEIFHGVPELINKPFKRKIWKQISARYYPKIDTKYTVNTSLKHIFKCEFKADFQVIRNVPPLLEKERSLPLVSNKTIVYLGVLNKGRGIELAINSLVTLTDYNLKLIGDGDVSADLKALTQELNLESRVEFLGYLNPTEIHKELELSSIGLNMLIPESENYKLSLANKFFDYMHAGLPSVNMNFPEYLNINSKYEVSLLVNNYTTTDLIQALRFLEIDTNYKRLQKSCLLARQVFNWENESKKLIDIFKSVTTTL